MEGITVTKISLESWYKDRSQAVKWRKFPLNQSHSELWAAEDSDGSRATSLLITAQNKPEQQGESGVYVEIPHSASLEESQCLTEKPLRFKKKGKATNPSLKISHTPTAPSQMHGCLERPPLFFKVSRKTVEKCNRNTEASEGDQVYSQTASISVWSIHVDLSMDCRGGFSGYKLECRLNLTRQCNLKG